MRQNRAEEMGSGATERTGGEDYRGGTLVYYHSLFDTAWSPVYSQ